jgi:SAM-dependent methyltransferase
MGSTHRDFSLDQSVAYIDSVFEDYLRYGEIGADDLRGARVMELGPGDNLGVAMRFLAAGAERVEGVDRFATWRDETQQAAIQAALVERLGKPVPMTGIETTEGLPIEEAAGRFEPGSFDFIVSRAVLEHVYDPDATFAAIDSLLKPGGKSVHKIDFEDHGLFTAGGLHPLTFLTIPDRLYRWMSENSGLPNRHLADYFRRKMDAMGYAWELFYTHLIEDDSELEPHPRELDPELVEARRGTIAEIRPRLLPRFRELDGADLAVSGVFLCATKPTSG